MSRWKGAAAIALLAPLGVGSPACSSDETARKATVQDAGPRTTFPDVGTPMNPVVSCADARCDEPATTPFAERACCTETDECGLRAPGLSDACRAPHGDGSVDISCPEVTLRDGTTLQGCCTPRDECGVFDRFGDLGCIPPVRTPNPDGGARDAAVPEASAPCHYDPDATCRSIVALPCDGPEDCAGGARCCARLAHGQYDRYSCFDSCAEHARSSREVWLEVCHPGEACSDPRLACRSEPPLPAFLGRCYDERPPLPEGGPRVDGGDAGVGSPASDAASVDAGHVPHPGISCGAATCGGSTDAGTQSGSTPMKCCLTEPNDPYCETEGTPCACRPARREMDAEHAP